MNREKNYITHLGFKKLQDELIELSRNERPEVLKVIAWAASNGDRSENADYLYGRKRLREIDKRCRFLSSRLDRAVVVNPAEIKSEKIQFGATVTLSDEDTGNERVVCIVGVDEIDTKKQWLSWKSPIGMALIGKKVGDSVLIMAPGGMREYEIISIEYKELI